MHEHPHHHSVYTYQDDKFVVADTRAWEAWPPRPRGKLVARFTGTVVLMPFWIVFAVAVFCATLAIGLLTEVIAAVSSSYEKGFDRFMDRALGRVTTLPGWCVGWSEMRHEGDAAHYRARVDGHLARWTARASAERRRGKPLPPVECEIPRRVYRGVGGHYVVRAAAAQGWELRPSDPDTSIRLWWSAASAPDAPPAGAAYPA